jgi:hypothetical protein
MAIADAQATKRLKLKIVLAAYLRIRRGTRR